MTHHTPKASRSTLPHLQPRGQAAYGSPSVPHPVRKLSAAEHGSVEAPRAYLRESARLATPSGAPGWASAGTARHAALGSALAGSMWTWAPPARPPSRPVTTGVEHLSSATATVIQASGGRREAEAQATPPVELSMPSVLLRAMAAAAATSGRRECDVWAEAAREWLLRHSQDDDPPPPPPATAAPDPALPRTTRERCWTAIDVLLNDLRGTSRPVPAAPAALASTVRYHDYPAA